MKNMLTRRVAPAAILAALMLSTAQPALANNEALAYPVIPGCEGFNVTLSATGGNQALHVTKTKGDLVHTITGGHGSLITVTRLNGDNSLTDTSVTFTTNGSVTHQTDDVKSGKTVLRLTGFHLVVHFPGEPRGPGTILYTGKTVITANTADFLFETVTSTGRQRDICAELVG